MKTALLFFPYFAWGLTLLTFVRPLSTRRRVRCVWAAFLLVCASKFHLFSFFGGNAFNPEFPAVVIWAANYLYSGMMLLAAFALIARVFRMKGRVLLLLPLMAWGLALRGIYNGLRVPEVREIVLAYDNLPPELDGYRIAHLTDLHVSASARRWRTEAVVRRINDLWPDLIVCTGDIVDGRVETEGPDVAPLCDLTAPDGVYYCAGNHEYYLDSENWLQQYREWNFRLLDNECAFPRPSLAVAGVPDRVGFSREVAPEPDAVRAFAAATNGEFRVFLMHRPCDRLSRTDEASFDLQLSGHTHGGIMPVLKWLVKGFNRGYVRGLYAEDGGKRIYVSSGAGQWAGFPIRFCNDSEITLVTLRASSDEKTLF